MSAITSRWGFRDPELAQKNLDLLGEVPDEVASQIVAVADPDTALSSLARIGEALGSSELVDLMAVDPVLAQRLTIVLGTSAALGDFLARHPEFVSDLARDELYEQPPTEAEYRTWVAQATDPDELRVQYYRALLRIAARDLTALTSFQQSSGELSDLAVATLGAALNIALAAEKRASSTRLTIMALGKTGGHELNYISDVDVIFIYEPAEGAEDHVAMNAARRLASAVMRICGDHTGEGTIWEVDAGLRPEGKDGPLVRTLASHFSYYEKWASTWEFQALLKARFAAGDAELAAEYLAVLSPRVWEVSQRPNFVPDMRAMRRRVIENIPHQHRDRQLKLGSGGLRDVEFAVQMLQLVHGRADESIHSPTTLVALQELIDGGYVGRRDGHALEEAYEFLRTLEHRIQLYRLRRLQTVPEDDEDLRRIGRSMGFRINPAENLVKDWRAHRRVVSSLHEKLFYRPLLDAVAALPTDRMQLRLSEKAAEQRLSALGFVDPRGAMSHIEALTRGVSRRSIIHQSLLPAMLEWFSESPDPDRGLLAFRKVSEELGESHWYLRKLRDEGEGAQQLAYLLSSSSYVADLLMRAPDVIALLGDDSELVPHDLDRLSTEMHLAASRHQIPDGSIRAIRRIRRRELARVAICDLLGLLDIVQVGESLTAINSATISAALRTLQQAWTDDHGTEPAALAIVLMGRLGGHEAGYGSDADVMFLHEAVEGADEAEAAAYAKWVAQTLRTMLGAPGDDPPLAIDADLRPEGKNGPLVRSLESYRAYYSRWSETWEAQALLRADPVVGDRELCEKFRQLIDPLRYPEGGLTEDEVREIRRVKARVDAERLPRGANPKTHLKLGRGGLADIEWTVQLLQLRHADEVPGLRTTQTLKAIDAAVEAGLVTKSDGDTLAEAWRLVSRIRNGVVLMRGKPAESMVEAQSDRAGLAHLLGWNQDDAGAMVDHYLRVTRYARQVVDRVFWE